MASPARPASWWRFLFGGVYEALDLDLKSQLTLARSCQTARSVFGERAESKFGGCQRSPADAKVRQLVCLAGVGAYAASRCACSARGLSDPRPRVDDVARVDELCAECDRGSSS